MSTFKYYKDGQWNVVSGEIVGDTLPIGSMVPYGSTTAPTNWLICDGSAVSRTTYSELFAVIGTSYGAGDGSTTFNLPNYKGRVPVGYDSSQTEFDTMGETGGSKTVTLNATQIPAHHHGQTIYWSGGTTTNQVGVTYNMQGQTNNKFWASYDNEGGGQAHNNLQPYQVSCFIIKAKQSAGLVGNVTNTQSSSQEDTYSCKHINDMMDYSTNEVNTGRKWVDEKDIYKKVIDMGTMSSNKQHNISNLSWVVNMYGTAKTNDGNYLPISFANNNGLQYQLSVYPTSTTINVNKGSGITITNSYVTIEYTKTS